MEFFGEFWLFSDTRAVDYQYIQNTKFLFNKLWWNVKIHIC